EHRLVDVPVGEHVLLEVLDRVLLEVLERPVRLRGPEALVRVEALDPALRVLLVAWLPVRRAGVPEVQVAVEDVVLLAVLLVHPDLLLNGREVEVDVLGRVLRVGEQHDAIVEHDHAPVVGAHDLLEVVVAEIVPPEGLRDLLVVEVDLVLAVDADHRRQLGDGHVGLAAHHVRDDVADLVVHQRDAAHVGGRAVLRELRHAATPFGAWIPRSPARLSKRSRERSNESSKRTTFSDSCDQIGCRLRAALTAAGVYVSSQPCMTARLASPCSSSSARSWNSARELRCSRAASDSPAPMIVGVTKSPCGAAACMTNPERKSSPTSGSKTTVVAKNASDQSRMPVRPSTSSRVGCQIGSDCQVSLWTEPSKPSISSDSVRL